MNLYTHIIHTHCCIYADVRRVRGAQWLLIIIFRGADVRRAQGAQRLLLVLRRTEEGMDELDTSKATSSSRAGRRELVRHSQYKYAKQIKLNDRLPLPAPPSRVCCVLTIPMPYRNEKTSTQQHTAARHTENMYSSSTPTHDAHYLTTKQE